MVRAGAVDFGALAALAVLAAIVAVFGTAIAAVPLAILPSLWNAAALFRDPVAAQGDAAFRGRDRPSRRKRPLHAQRGSLGRPPARRLPLGHPRALTRSKAVLLEGVELIVIVIGIGAAGGCCCRRASARPRPASR